MTPEQLEQLLKVFGPLTKIEPVEKPTVFADQQNKAHLLIEHPHSYREWTIVGEAAERGFYTLESRISIGQDCYDEDRTIYTRFALCLHESEFERI